MVADNTHTGRKRKPIIMVSPQVGSQSGEGVVTGPLRCATGVTRATPENVLQWFSIPLQAILPRALQPQCSDYLSVLF